jgi:uncharacterized protein YdeI (YjbR/CyaY-like superfamily)
VARGPASDVKPKFFPTADALRAWFAKHAASSPELLVGFYKQGSGRPSVTWPEAVDEALCVGWIDGVRRRIDDVSYLIRFTPRRATSTWSAVNIAKYERLEALGRVKTAGRAAFVARRDEKSRTYSYEQRATAALAPADEARFRRHRQAWDYFAAQAPSYRKVMVWWVVSAKREATRQARLERLIAASGEGKRL